MIKEIKLAKTPLLHAVTRALMVIVITVHLLFFLLEAVLWMRPEVNVPLIDLLNNPVASDHALQALTLRNLFINQGFYNLFLVMAGVGGWALIRKGFTSPGYVLWMFLCLAALGAGLVLAFTTNAYLLAFCQAGPAAIALMRLWPAGKRLLS